MRVAVRVRAGSRRPAVGGRHGDGDPPVLRVAVAAPAVEGRANEEVRSALAAAFGVPRAGVALVAGHRGRAKVFEVAGADRARLDQLLEG